MTGTEPLDFHAFHRTELPRRLATGNGALAAIHGDREGSFAFRISGGDAYSYVPTEGGIEIVPGDADADTVVEVSQETWEGIVRDVESAPGLLYAGRVKCVRGDGLRFVRWEPAWRAMFHGRPIFDPENNDLRDRSGGPLDPARSFLASDDPQDMAHFLRTTGYLFVRELFSADEVAAFVEDAAAVRREAREGDHESWWGRNAAGESVLCRVINAGRRPRLQRLREDPRLTALVGLADEKLAPSVDESGERTCTVLWKNPNVTEGLSDLPFHRDCGMGGHAIMCPILIASVNLTEASLDSGALRMLPGSWRASYPFVDPRHPRAPAGVTLNAGPGDVSLHYSDVMHASPPPTGSGPYRISLLMAYTRPGARHHRGERAYNEVLLSRDDGQVEHLETVIGREHTSERS
jgi:ectoine hydroxylase-related dioxygenase (phytanoyl-CoA dioxygenase family)